MNLEDDLLEDEYHVVSGSPSATRMQLRTFQLQLMTRESNLPSSQDFTRSLSRRVDLPRVQTKYRRSQTTLALRQPIGQLVDDNCSHHATAQSARGRSIKPNPEAKMLHGIGGVLTSQESRSRLRVPNGEDGTMTPGKAFEETSESCKKFSYKSRC